MVASEGWMRALAAAGEARARACSAVRADEVTARVQRLHLGVEAEVRDGAVRLRGPGLLARALGTRRRAPDPRLAWLAIWLSSGGD